MGVKKRATGSASGRSKRRRIAASSDPIEASGLVESSGLVEASSLVATSSPTDVNDLKTLSEEELKTKLLEAVTNSRDKAWLGIIILFQHYKFSRNDLMKYLNC